MPILDAILSVIAPHECLGCGWEGSLLCVRCVQCIPPLSIVRCFKCDRRTLQGLLCRDCSSKSALTGVIARTDHYGLAKQLIHALKFERVVAAAKPAAISMANLIPHDVPNVVMTAVPTASSRVRQRGYDQAALLARQVARRCKLPYVSLLQRNSQSRQVGASRKQRQIQLIEAFEASHKHLAGAQNVILVDDVMTTGSSLEAAARALKRAGAANVYGLVFARQQ